MASFNKYQPTDIEPGRLNCWDCKYNFNCEDVNKDCVANCIFNKEVWHYKDCFKRNIKTLSDLFGHKIESVTGCHKGSDCMSIKFEDGLSLTIKPATNARVEISKVNRDPQGMVHHLIKNIDVKKVKETADSEPSITFSFFGLASFDENIEVEWYGSSNGYYSVNWYIKDEKDKILAQNLL